MKAKQIALILVVLLLLSSLASAGFFSDLWDKMTGRATALQMNGGGGSGVASNAPSPGSAPTPGKESDQGQVKVIENQANQLAKNSIFANNKNAQAAIKKIKEDVAKLKAIISKKPTITAK